MTEGRKKPDSAWQAMGIMELHHRFQFWQKGLKMSQFSLEIPCRKSNPQFIRKFSSVCFCFCGCGPEYCPAVGRRYPRGCGPPRHSSIHHVHSRSCRATGVLSGQDDLRTICPGLTTLPFQGLKQAMSVTLGKSSHNLLVDEHWSLASASSRHEQRPISTYSSAAPW